MQVLDCRFQLRHPHPEIEYRRVSLWWNLQTFMPIPILVRSWISVAMPSFRQLIVIGHPPAWCWGHDCKIMRKLLLKKKNEPKWLQDRFIWIPRWVYTGSILGLYCVYTGSIWVYSRSILGLYWVYTGSLLGLYWLYMGLCWIYTGSMWVYMGLSWV